MSAALAILDYSVHGNAIDAESDRLLATAATAAGWETIVQPIAPGGAGRVPRGKGRGGGGGDDSKENAASMATPSFRLPPPGRMPGARPRGRSRWARFLAGVFALSAPLAAQTPPSAAPAPAKPEGKPWYERVHVGGLLFGDAYAVVRMPRFIGTRCGVKITSTCRRVAHSKIWSISGVCRCWPTL